MFNLTLTLGVDISPAQSRDSRPSLDQQWPLSTGHCDFPMSEQQPFGRSANPGVTEASQTPRLPTPPPSGYLRGPVAPPATPAPLGRYIRWQMLLAVVGIILLTLLMGVTAYNVSTVLVPERGGVLS